MIRAIFTEVGRSSKILEAINVAEQDDNFKDILTNLSEEERKDLEKRKEQLAKKDFPVTDIQLEALKSNSFIKQVLVEYGDALYDLDERKIKVKASKYVFNDEGELDISETSKLKSIKNANNRREVRNNMLIDVIEAIITSPYGSGRSQKPGQFDSLKRQAVIHKIVDDSEAFNVYKQTHPNSKNILEDLMQESTEDLQKFYDNYAKVQNPNDILYYINQHYNLMQGNDLIGGGAVASSNQQKLQNLPNCALKKEFSIQLPFIYQGKEYHLGEQGINRMTSPITELNISDLYAEVQAAAPDNGKYPVLGYIGVNMENLFFVNYLIGLGLPIESISSIMMIYKNLDYYLGQYFDKKKYKYDSVNNKYLKSNSLQDGYDGNLNRAVNMLLSIDPNQGTSISHSTYIRGFLNTIISLESQAYVLNKISSYSRVDSTNGALPVLSAEAIQQRLRIQDFISHFDETSFPFNGIKEFIDTTINPEDYINSDGTLNEEFRQQMLRAPIPRMQAMYSLGILGASTLASRYLLNLNNSVLDNLQKIAKENKVNLLSSEGLVFIQNYLKNITTYLMSSNQLLGNYNNVNQEVIESEIDKSNYYIKNFPLIFFNNKAALIKKYPHLSILKNLIVSRKKGIILQSVTNITEITRSVFREEFDYMLKSNDKTLNNLAVHLFLYDYYKTGSQYKHNSYGILFSTFFLDMMGDIIPDLKTATRAFQNPVENKLDIERYSLQFIMNNPSLLPSIGNYQMEKVYIDKGNGEKALYFALEKSKEGVIRKYEYNDNTQGKKSQKYILYRQKSKDKNGKTYYQLLLLERVTMDQSNYYYRQINYNKTAFNTDSYRPYYNRNASNQEFNDEILRLKEQAELIKIDKENKKDSRVLEAEKNTRVLEIDNPAYSRVGETKSSTDNAYSRVEETLVLPKGWNRQSVENDMPYSDTELNHISTTLGREEQIIEYAYKGVSRLEGEDAMSLVNKRLDSYEDSRENRAAQHTKETTPKTKVVESAQAVDNDNHVCKN